MTTLDLSQIPDPATAYMKTGPECYHEALFLVSADPDCSCPMYGCEHHQTQIARAQVYATAALAAATALGHWTGDGTMPQPDRMDWWRAASGEPAERQRVKEAREAEAAEFAAEVPIP